jgi:hypothetical protein
MGGGPGALSPQPASAKLRLVKITFAKAKT